MHAIAGLSDPFKGVRPQPMPGGADWLVVNFCKNNKIPFMAPVCDQFLEFRFFKKLYIVWPQRGWIPEKSFKEHAANKAEIAFIADFYLHVDSSAFNEFCQLPKTTKRVADFTHRSQISSQHASVLFPPQPADLAPVLRFAATGPGVE